MKNFAYLSRAAAVAIVLVLLLPAGALAGYTEGMECYKSKDWDCVVAQFLTEVQAHPDYDFGWFMMGIAKLQGKEYDAAVENFKRPSRSTATSWATTSTRPRPTPTASSTTRSSRRSPARSPWREPRARCSA